MKNLDKERYACLYSRIDEVQPHPDGLKKDIIKKSSIEQFKKNEIIVKPGEISRYCYFIVEGFVRLYHEHEQKEVTTWFLHTTDFMIQQHGFYFGQKSPEYLQATEKTICIKIHIDDLKWLFKKYPMFKDTYIHITHIYYFQVTQREGWKAYSAKEKYQKLLTEYPYIIQMAQSAHIASYFGLSESHYSKIKNGRV